MASHHSSSRGKQQPSEFKLDAVFELGRSFLQGDNERVAHELFLQVLRSQPDNLHCRYLSTVCAFLLGDEDTLEENCAYVLSVARRHPYAVACEAVRYLYLGNYERAESFLEQALRALPRNPDIYLGLVLVQEYRGDSEKGIENCKKLLELEPDCARAHLALGSFCAMEGDFEAALAAYQRARELVPEVENPHMRLGCDYYYNGLLDQAMAEFSVVVGEEPDYPAAYFYLMDCLRRLGRTDEALDVYQDIRHRFDQCPEETAGLFERFQMKRETVAALEKLCRRRPRSAELLFRLSVAYREAGRLQEALATAQRLVRLAPKEAEAHSLLAELYFRLEQYQAAAGSARRAIQLNPNAQESYLVLADSLLFLGRQNESHRVVQEMEAARRKAWETYQARFSGQDRVDRE